MRFSKLAPAAIIAAALPSGLARPGYSPEVVVVNKRQSASINNSIITDLPCAPSNISYPYPPPGICTVQTGKDCSKYGDPPAPVVNLVEGPLGIQEVIGICHGEIITLKDNIGETRQACLYVNKASTKAKPLPLLVWLHPSGFTASDTFPLTGIDLVRDTQSLNNEDPSRLGFSYILPFGRTTTHQYPLVDRNTPGWDNWYRNLDRSSSTLNADVDFIDKAIAYAKEKAVVDPRRVFLSGWSNGAAMALLYALNTDKIAAASVYSAPDPYRDIQDPCTQTPYPTFATPTSVIHNYCDIVGICTTGQYFYQDLAKRYKQLKQQLVIVDPVTKVIKSKNAQSSCDLNCQGSCITVLGSAAHGIYPVSRNNDTIFGFMKENPLPSSGSYGAPK